MPGICRAANRKMTAAVLLKEWRPPLHVDKIVEISSKEIGKESIRPGLWTKQNNDSTTL